ncbi:hypothetical protein COOONC_09941 [Cooperia oncophora]
MACRLRHRDCIKQAQHRYNEWIMKKKRRISLTLLGVVLDEGVRQGGTAAWERAYTAYLEAKSPTEKYQLIGAMASTTQPALISRKSSDKHIPTFSSPCSLTEKRLFKVLRLCIEGSSFRPNVIPRLLADLTKNEAARSLTWRVSSRQTTKRIVLGDGSSLLINSLRAMLDKLSTQEDLDEVKAFLADKRVCSRIQNLGSAR